MARLKGKEAALRRMRALYPEVAKVVIAETRIEVEKLAEAMKRVVPKKTGVLKRSIRVEDVEGKPGVFRIIAGGVPETRKKVRKGVKDADFALAKQAGNNKGEFDYARAVEFGHIAEDGTQVPADPYFYPTYRAQKRGMGRRISAKARKQLKETFNK